MWTYSGVNPEMKDDLSAIDSQDWSIYKATTLLTDSLSMYDDSTEMFNSTPHLEFNCLYDMTPKTVKAEPLTELLPFDGHHYNDWQSKYIDHWAPRDCLYWLIHELQDLKVGQTLAQVKMEKLTHINGASLQHMTVDDFNQISPEFGRELFHRLQRFKSQFSYNGIYSCDQWYNSPLQRDEPISSYPSAPQETHMLTDLDNKTNLHLQCPASSTVASTPYCSPSEADSGYKSDSSSESMSDLPPPPPEKRKPGRPRGTKRKKKPEKLGRLWEFIRDLLLNPMYNPSLICWENYEEGTFRFVHSDRVAKLWGSKKDNVDMNYEKLSRAMRYYYKSQVLLPVYGKRLVYKFGPTATGWRSERPIFRQG